MKRDEAGVLFISLHTNRNYWYIEKTLEPPMSAPLGMLYIAAYIRQFGFTKIRFVDFGVDRMSQSSFRELLREFDPFLVGISVYAETHQQAITLSRAVKRSTPQAKVICGNAQATFTSEELLGERSIDYVCMGEGEVTTYELLERLVAGDAGDLSDVKGLAWKRDGKIVVNARRNKVLHIDALPFPDRSLMADKDGYADTFTLISGRGCPGKCSFCCSRAFWGAGFTLRSAENLFAEVKLLYEAGWHEKTVFRKGWFFILDDHFTINTKRVYRFCDLLRQEGIDLFWHCATRLDILDRDLMQHMYDAGCRHLQIGVESANQDILNAINKELDLSTLEGKIQEARDIGLEVSAGFIIGFPQDTRETINYNVEFATRIWDQYNLSNIGLAFLTPFPGTPIYDNAEASGLKWIASNWSQLSLFRPSVRTENFSEQDLINAYQDFITYARKRHEKQERMIRKKIYAGGGGGE